MASSESLQVRLRPARAPRLDSQRNSNLVRASVLETALEIGFGQNSTVANWIFNNPLSEEPEDSHFDQGSLDTKPDPDPAPHVAEAITPTLTSGSNSTSDESSSLNSPANNAPSAAITTIQVHSHKPSLTEPPCIHFDDFPSDQLQLFSPFTLSPHDAHHAGTRGNSMGKLPRDTERSRSQDDSLRHKPRQQTPSPPDTGYTSEGQYLAKAKTKDKAGKTKGDKGSKSKTLDTSKTGEKDGEYTSDGGYLSASSNKSLGKSPGKVKSRAMAFFRRRPKKPARGSDDEEPDPIPPVPAIPTLARPSSPKLLEHRAAPSSPTRSGFPPLTLNLTSPPATPSRRRVSNSPPPARARPTLPQQSSQLSVRSTSSPVATTSGAAVLTPATAATFPLPPSMPGTPLLAASFPTTSSLSVSLAGPTKPLAASTSRQHLSIPPPAPPPTLPLPQLPPPSPTGAPQPLPLAGSSITPSRKGAPTRPVPVVPATTGSTRPLTPRGTASPFRPLLSPRVIPTAVSHARTGEVPEGDLANGREFSVRQRSGTASTGNTPAFLQRKIQAPSPRHPPPDIPLPPSPCPVQDTRCRAPIGAPSKFHEHFSSVSSVPLSQVLATPKSMSPSPSTTTLSGSSSGPSVRSSHLSSTSERSEDRVVTRDRLNAMEYSRPTTSTSIMSESSYGHPIASTFGRRSGMNVKSHFSDRSDLNSSVYSSTTHHENGSITTFDDDDDPAPKSCVDDDDASLYPSEDKTAGRRTMYLLEHGEMDDNGDEIVMAGSHYWGPDVPPVPPLPTRPTRPGPGYF